MLFALEFSGSETDLADALSVPKDNAARAFSGSAPMFEHVHELALASYREGVSGLSP
jgi:hypothetical protein